MLYVGVLSIFLTGVVYFSWDIIYGRVKARTQQEVSQNLRLASQRLDYEIRNASSITSVTASNLCLVSADRGPIIFYLSGSTLMIGWGNTCASPANSYALTSNTVSISNVQFQNLTTLDSKSKNISYSITVTNISTRKEWQKTQTYSSSIELRSN
jgi:hypothetical protein